MKERSQPEVSRAILDTNVFVAAGFRPGSASARLVDAVRRGRLILVWNDATRGEARRVLQRIPRLSWRDFEPLFVEAGYFEGPIRPEDHREVADPADRKFAALAEASGAILVSSDRDFLPARERAAITVGTPSEVLERVGL